MTRLALIPPASLMDTLDGRSRYHLILAQEILKDTEYGKWYDDNLRVSEFVILDNGAAEGEMVDFDMQWYVAHRLCADEIVAHDVMGDAKASLDKTFEFLMKMEERLHQSERPWQPKAMVVAQGQTHEEALDMIKTVLTSVYDMYVGSIGIPRHFVKTFGHVKARINFAKALYETLSTPFYRPFDIHFLGANYATRTEFEWIREEVPFVRGLDTSMPYNYAFNDAKVTDSDTDLGKRPKDYFDLPYESFNDAKLKYNIDTMLRWAGGNHS